MKDYSEEKSFWIRLKLFIKDIEVSDICGHEEKEMILHVTDNKLKILNDFHDPQENSL